MAEIKVSITESKSFMACFDPLVLVHGKIPLIHLLFSFELIYLTYYL